jgi:hypothetical protein
MTCGESTSSGRVPILRSAGMVRACEGMDPGKWRRDGVGAVLSSVEWESICSAEGAHKPMTVEMGILHRSSGEYEVVPVATTETFRSVWLPACDRLGLKLVPLFAGGALTTVPLELVPQIVDEVERLRAGSAGLPNGDYLADRCSDVLAAFSRTDPASCEYNFG